jgi:hypothetical protein
MRLAIAGPTSVDSGKALAMSTPKMLAGVLVYNRASSGLNHLLRPKEARTSWIGRAATCPARR